MSKFSATEKKAPEEKLAANLERYFNIPYLWIRKLCTDVIPKEDMYLTENKHPELASSPLNRYIAEKHSTHTCVIASSRYLR